MADSLRGRAGILLCADQCAKFEVPKFYLCPIKRMKSSGSKANFRALQVRHLQLLGRVSLLPGRVFCNPKMDSFTKCFRTVGGCWSSRSNHLRSSSPAARSSFAERTDTAAEDVYRAECFRQKRPCTSGGDERHFPNGWKNAETALALRLIRKGDNSIPPRDRRLRSDLLCR
jgi:hypothetical protein